MIATTSVSYDADTGDFNDALQVGARKSRDIVALSSPIFILRLPGLACAIFFQAINHPVPLHIFIYLLISFFSNITNIRYERNRY